MLVDTGTFPTMVKILGPDAFSFRISTSSFRNDTEVRDFQSSFIIFAFHSNNIFLIEPSFVKCVSSILAKVSKSLNMIFHVRINVARTHFEKQVVGFVVE